MAKRVRKSDREDYNKPVIDNEQQRLDIEAEKKRLIEEFRQKKVQLMILEAREKYSKYVELVHAYDRKFKIAKFQEYICDCLDLLIENKLLNAKGNPVSGICLSQPSQTGKSRCVTETFPSYYLGKYPYDHVLEVSYSGDFAERFGRRNMEKISEFGQAVFDISLSPSKATFTEFEIHGTKGGMVSQGIDGQITGISSDLTIIDDPYKGMIDADSPATKRLVMSQWLNAIKLRASSKCKYVIVHTRWNEDDLIGYLSQNEPDDWYVINLPIVAEQDEPMTGRKVGDPLLPEAGKDLAWAMKLKSTYERDPELGGMRTWNAVMMGKPNALEGNIIKRNYWKRYRLSLDMQRGNIFHEEIQSWDCAFKDTADSDYVAGHCWGRIGLDYYLKDVIHERMDIVKTMDEIMRFSSKHKNAKIKLIEEKANGAAVIQMLRIKLNGLIPVNPSVSKYERVNLILHLFEGGSVYIPDEVEVAPGVWQKCRWAEEVITECANFRPERKTGKDDHVDAATMALGRLMYSFAKQERHEKKVVGFASENEMRDMGIIPFANKPRRPGRILNR